MAEKLNIVGKTFAGYAVEKRVGAGGMGIVFRALDERLGRTVALKILPPSLVQDETTRQRFLREGRTAARIDHPNVVRLLAAGEDQGYPYLVMEYVDGGTLQQRMDRFKRLPAAETIAIGRQIAGALGAAHKAGILHRDIKPANVLFSREGEAKLADFGLAREENTNVSLSVTGMVMGTPHYMAPEVCEGKKADPRSDLYSLGVMLYYMVSGRYPFDSTAIMEVLMAHVQETAPPLKEAPQALAAVVDCLMAKDPGARLQTADEIIAALDEAARAPGLPGSVSAARAATPGSAVAGSGSRLISVSGSSSTSAAASPGATVPVPAAGVSMVGPLPRTHVLAYAVAGVTVLASTILLTWAFTIQKTGGSGPAGVQGGGGKADVPVDPDLLRRGEEFRRWQAFAERVRAPGADPGEALRELEAFAIDEEEKKGLRDDLYGRLKARLGSELLARERDLVSLVATDPAGAVARAENRTSWPPYPFVNELKEAENRAESRVWDAILERTRAEVGRLEEKGEYRAGLEAWDRIRPPFPEKRLTVQGEKSGVEFRAKQRADAAVKEAPSGRAGAEAIRAVAAKMPSKIAEEMENIAFLRERADATGGPLEQLRGLLLERDFAGLMRQLEHLEKTGQGVDRGKLETAKRLTASGQQLVRHAMQEFRRLAEAKADVEIERADFSVVKGQMFEVADDDSEIRLAVASGIQPISLAELGARELARRSMGANPPDDRLVNALDFGIVMSERELAFGCARAFLRRGLPLQPYQEQSLTAMIAPEDLKEAEALQDQIERAASSGGTPDSGLARRYLDRFGNLPLGLRERRRAEHVLARGGGTPDARDFARLLTVPAADAGGGQVEMVWAGSDAMLEDFWMTGKATVACGEEGLTVTPVDPQVLLVLEGLRFGRVQLHIELKCDRGTRVAILSGYRTPFDGIGTNLVLETTPAESGADYPLGDRISPVNSSTDGWHRLDVQVADASYSIAVNGTPKKMSLPVSWEGQVAIVITGPATFREVRVTGVPRWDSFDLDLLSRAMEDELRTGAGAAVPAGSWLKAGSKEAVAALEAGREPSFLRPQRWGGGSDWVVSFKARLEGEGTRESWPQMFLDFRTGSRQTRRLILAGDSRNGFMSKDGWMRTGFCSEFTTGKDHEIMVMVKGEHGVMLVDGKVAWLGVMGPAATGGPAIGVRSGQLTVSDLHVRAIEK